MPDKPTQPIIATLGHPLGNDDFLRIYLLQITANHTFDIAYQILKPNGKIVYGQKSHDLGSSAPASTTLIVPLQEGTLIACAVKVGTAISSPSSWATVSIQKGSSTTINAPHLTIISGSPLTTTPLSYPPASLKRPGEGPPLVSGGLETDPAATTPVTIPTLSNTLMKIIGIQVAFDTVSTAGDRHVYLWSTTTTYPPRIFAGTTQQASESKVYSFAPLGRASFESVDDISGILPHQEFFFGGEDFFIGALGIKTGDQFYDITTLLHYWPLP